MSMTPSQPAGYGVKPVPYRLRPEAPRSIRATAGSMECLLVWNSPADPRGVNGFRVYLSSEDNLILQLAAEARQARLKLPADTKDIAFVSTVSELGRESPKIPVMVSSNSDKYIQTGMTGATSGSSAPTAPEYDSEPTGGKRRRTW